MFRSYLFLFLSLTLLSCGKSSSGGSEVPATAESESMEFTSDTVPNAAITWDANVEMVNFSRNQEEKVHKAVELIKKVVASDEFKKKIINHTYKGKKTFVDNGGLTNSQIYKRILDAAEKLAPTKNNTMDVTLVTYFTSANVIGYTLPSANKIWMNRRYLDTFTPVQVSSNLFHEWLHKLGFKHDFEKTPSRPFSVPYAFGYIVKSLAAKVR